MYSIYQYINRDYLLFSSVIKLQQRSQSDTTKNTCRRQGMIWSHATPLSSLCRPRSRSSAATRNEGVVQGGGLLARCVLRRHHAISGVRAGSSLQAARESGTLLRGRGIWRCRVPLSRRTAGSQNPCCPDFGARYDSVGDQAAGLGVGRDLGRAGDGAMRRWSRGDQRAVLTVGGRWD